MLELIAENPRTFWCLIGLVLIYGVWRLIKYCVYQLAYVIGKGLKDARGE